MSLTSLHYRTDDRILDILMKKTSFDSNILSLINRKIDFKSVIDYAARLKYHQQNVTCEYFLFHSLTRSIKSFSSSMYRSDFMEKFIRQL